jgi:hypothetical protein
MLCRNNCRLFISKGVYNGLDKDLTVNGYRQGLIINSSVSDDVFYNTVKVFSEYWVSEMNPVAKLFSTFQPEELSLPIDVEFHPKSLKYFKERCRIKQKRIYRLLNLSGGKTERYILYDKMPFLRRLIIERKTENKVPLFRS